MKPILANTPPSAVPFKTLQEIPAEPNPAARHERNISARMTLQNSTHHRQRPRKSVVQFDHVSKHTHPATTFTGRIHCITVSRPFLVKPVIATNLVRWGSRSGLGASKSGSKFSNLLQKGLSGSTLFPRLAI